MTKINTQRFADVEFEDAKLVESIERVMTAVELLEARGRTSSKQTIKFKELEEENAKLKHKIDKLTELVNQHYDYIKSFPNQLEEVSYD